MNRQLLRLALDLGPLLIFFASFKYFGIFGATGAFMVAVLVALVVGWWIERRLSPMPLFTAVLVVIFGGLTLYLQNEIRWGVFFIGLAVANEAVWRSTSTDTWVSFKVWGILPLIFLFALAQTPLVMKHQAQGGQDGA
jgi:intracellular septation protein